MFSDEVVKETLARLNSKSRDLFRPCVQQVRDFLSQEPFREFRYYVFCYNVTGGCLVLQINYQLLGS